MIDETSRASLYYLGFISSILFGTRMLLQWVQSEKAEKSVASLLFWKISITANIINAIHCFIQLQYPLCLIQTGNIVLSWRNFEIITQKPGSISKVFLLIAMLCGIVTLGFWVQSLGSNHFIWSRIPLIPWQKYKIDDVDLFWPIIGYFGTALFALRFWIQWWQAETKNESHFSPSFWLISLIGALLALVYFVRIHDLSNIIAYSTGLIPYVRNLILSRKT